MKTMCIASVVLSICVTASAGRPLVVAHRGASRAAPENTLPAFRLAWERGADAIEGDFRLTADGRVVCIHDGNTKRVAGRNLVVAKSTLEQLRALDVGARRGKAFAGTVIPTLAEVLTTVPPGKKIYVEIKCGTEIMPPLLKRIDAAGLHRTQVVVISFNRDVIRAVKSRRPRLKAYWLASLKKDTSGKLKPTRETILATLKDIDADGFSSSAGAVDEGFIRGVRAGGFSYHVWTVDDPDAAARLAGWGAASITTNVPGRIRQALQPDPDTADRGLQLADNPPMKTIHAIPPEPPAVTGSFAVRDGFALVETLDAFRAAIKRDGQKLRMKPGVYRAAKCDPPMAVPLRHARPGADGTIPRNRQEHVFAVTGSDNHFDLRGVVIETPVSLQGTLSGKAHVADTWHINGSGNTFEGGYFRNVVDRPYPKYRVTENEFEVCNDDNTFLDCTFVIRGSVPYGYSDFYGKGGPNFGRLNKHSFMSIQNANGTLLRGCRVYQQSFGHCVHFHAVDGARIEDCLFSGTLRPTDDIFRENTGRAREYDFNIMYRGKRPIPRGHVIPLTEDGVRSYDRVKNIVVRDTVVQRMRGCFQLLCEGDVTLENVTVREAGDFCYDLSAGRRGNVVVKNCRADVAYNPVFNLTRGPVPVGAFYEVTILSPAAGAAPTPRTGLGTICGERCTFILRDGTTRPLPREVNRLHCGGRKGLRNSTVINRTAAALVLNGRVRDCRIESVGPVEDGGKNNTIVRLPAGD